MKKIDALKIVKIAVGCCAAVFLADLFGLRGGTSAGVITLLSIQNTKKETFLIAGKRIAAFFLALGAALAVFGPLGYHVPAFGLFLLLFVALCYLCGLEAGVSMSTVLISQMWASGGMPFSLICNQFFLLLIGISVAVVVNLYMPRALPMIREDQQQIDSEIKKLLQATARCLRGDHAALAEDAFTRLMARAREALSRAYDHANNTLVIDSRYYAQYIEMRITQCALLRRMFEQAARLLFVPEQAGALSDFLLRVAESFHEYNNAAPLLERLSAMRAAFKESPLPKTRKEFEARALLFQIADELEHFLLAKKRFADQLTPWQISYFWKEAPQAKKGN